MGYALIRKKRKIKEFPWFIDGPKIEGKFYDGNEIQTGS
jgi:hypothetical protein